MKILLIPVLLTFSSIALANIGEDVVTGTCKLTLSGNDYSGDKTLKMLKKSVHVEDVFARPRVNYKIIKYFHQVTPFADNEDLKQKYQVAMFRSDREVLSELSKEGVSYKLDKIRGQYNISIVYSGKPEKKVSIQIMSKHAETEKTEVFEFRNSKKLKIKFKAGVKFPYIDYGYDGFIGGIADAFKDDGLNAKDKKNAKRKIHKTNVNVVCNLNLDADFASVDVERDISKIIEKEQFKGTYDGKIVMPADAVEN